MPVQFTWRKLIEQALIESGLVGKNQPVNPVDFQIGQDLLDLMLDEWDGSPLSLPPFDTQITFNTVSAQSKYVLGPDSNPPSSDASPANTIRPEIIITGTVDLGGGVDVPIVEYPGGFANYQLASVKGTSSQPQYYALNRLWPQAELFLYPTPDKVYPVQLTCKVKWANTGLSNAVNIADWDASTTYTINSLIKYQGAVYRSLSRGTGWDAGIAYAIGDYVFSGNIVYISLSQGTTWNISTTYNINDLVFHNNFVYISLQNSNTGNDPITASAWWAKANVGNTPASSPTWWSPAIVGKTPTTNPSFWAPNQVGDPADNPYNNAQIPSGYASAVMYNLALRIAERYLEPTRSLENNASNGRFQIMSENYHQLKPDVTRNPMGTFPWVTGESGVNPPW